MKVKITGVVEHDGERVKIGASITVTDEQGDALLRAGVAEEVATRNPGSKAAGEAAGAEGTGGAVAKS